LWLRVAACGCCGCGCDCGCLWLLCLWLWLLVAAVAMAAARLGNKKYFGESPHSSVQTEMLNNYKKQKKYTKL
jgi:hypothetical protein